MDKTTRISLAVMVAAVLMMVTNIASADQTYRVVKGDNLGAIGKKFGISYKEIMAVNNLKSTTIYTGQVLKIPTSTGTQNYGKGYSAGSYTYPKPTTNRIPPPPVPGSSYSPAPVPQITPRPAPAPLPPVVVESPYSYPAPVVVPKVENKRPTRGVTEQCNVHYRGGSYVVQRGDSVRSISRKFGVAFWDLRMENDIMFSKIYPGMVLKIPTRAASVGIAY